MFNSAFGSLGLVVGLMLAMVVLAFLRSRRIIKERTGILLIVLILLLAILAVSVGEN